MDRVGSRSVNVSRKKRENASRTKLVKLGRHPGAKSMELVVGANTELEEIQNLRNLDQRPNGTS